MITSFSLLMLIVRKGFDEEKKPFCFSFGLYCIRMNNDKRHQKPPRWIEKAESISKIQTKHSEMENSTPSTGHRKKGWIADICVIGDRFTSFYRK